MHQTIKRDTTQDSLKLISGTSARRFYHLLKFLLVFVFLWSGISKAIQPVQFSETVGAYGLLPEILIFPAAVGMIALEIIVAAGLAFEKRGALSLMTLMMVLFMGVLSYGIFLGLDIDCGCFGPEDPEAEAFHNLRGALFRDSLLMLAIGYLYLWRFINRLTPSPWLGFGNNQAQTKEV
ncbi:MauE/DoxX family redox-associated membrane protein [uncultured Desulfuromusa sp.]|uniref:MauE/DoxX family redox-associated membrane protein n=1 Tax=uncultured Desulfuromusa sp. TaxID=219183 RepID=UPI002AA7EFF2|nr:MauE/DoxX family redox-associated membrane protein [uncultured Desulfuromusa sp.]